MNPVIYDQPWKVELWELMQRARRDGKHLFVNSLATGPMWFSPDGLEAEHRGGRFMWGVVNWTLRDPMAKLAAADRRLAEARAERDRIAVELA